MAVDSGACVSVGEPKDFPGHAVRDTPQSLGGEEFAAASGFGIPNLGEMTVPIWTQEDTGRLTSITAAPVVKPLASVKQLCDKGHAVVFSSDGSYIF